MSSSSSIIVSWAPQAKMLRHFKSEKSRSKSCSGQFRFLVILIRHFDMVAEQVRRSVICCTQLLSRMIKSKADRETSIISSSSSSSGKERRCQWDLHLKEGAEINTFVHDHRLNPRVPQPTSFDGVKPSFMEWSEEVIACLEVTDNQELMPLLTAAASTKDIIQADVMFTGVLSDTIAEIKKKGRSGQKGSRFNKNQTKNQNQKKILIFDCRDSWHCHWDHDPQRKNWSWKINAVQGDFFSDALWFMRLQGIQSSWSEKSCERQNSDSGAVTGLENWRQMTIHFAGPAKTGTSQCQVSVRTLCGLKSTTCSSTISTMQPWSRIRASISLQIPTRKRRSIMSRKTKAKVKNQKVLKKEKDQKGSSNNSHNRRAS